MSGRAALGVALLGGAYLYSRGAFATTAPAASGDDWLASLSTSLSDAVAGLETQATAFVAGASSAIEDVLQVGGVIAEPMGLNADANVAAFLQMIRYAEGTAGPDGYRTLYGGALFDGYADHPRRSVTASGRTSTAAGAYQFLSGTWDDARRALNLPDFSPGSQDRAAIWAIRRRGAMGDVRSGRFALAVQKCSDEWASLPGSPYGQPVRTLAQVQAAYTDAGGALG